MKHQKGTGVLDKPLDAVKFAETLTKKMIPSTKPVFDRYWKGDIAKNAFTGPTGVTSKKFWTHPKKGTVMRLVKNPKLANMKMCMKNLNCLTTTFQTPVLRAACLQRF